jgi:DNA-binding NtrC family response regulator
MTPSGGAAPRTPTPEGRRVLVVDDEESLRFSLGKALRRAGYVVETAATGREGADRLRAGGFDAVVTDVRLPDLSGLDLVALLTETAPGVPVIVMTGYGSVAMALEAMRRGARDFLRKPFETFELLVLLEREIARADPEGAGRRLRMQVERRFAPGEFAGVDSELRRGALQTPEGAGTGAPASTAPVGEAGLPRAGDDPLELREAQRRFEIRYVEDLLARTGGNVAAAARLAGISRPNFHKKCKALGVDPSRFKQARRRGRSAGS